MRDARGGQCGMPGAGAGVAGRSYRRPPAVVAGVEERGRRGARGGRRWELRSGEGRPGAGWRGGRAAGRPAAWRAGGEVSSGGGKEPSAGARGILGILGRRRVFRFWVFAEGPDLGPSAKMFLFF